MKKEEKNVRKQISIRIDAETIAFFKKKAADTGFTYQNLINLYLKDCAANSKKLKITWH